MMHHRPSVVLALRTVRPRQRCSVRSHVNLTLTLTLLRNLPAVHRTLGLLVEILDVEAFLIIESPLSYSGPQRKG